MRKIYLLLLVLVLILLTSYLYLNRKHKPSVIIPTQSEKIQSPSPMGTSSDVKQEIIKSLSQKNSWDESKVELNVKTVEGDYSMGDVKFKGEMGGGLWFAAKVNGVWKIVYDGNGIITCDQLTNYPQFPKDLIPQCYDKQTEKMVTR